MGPHLIKMESLEISGAGFYTDNEPNRTELTTGARNATTFLLVLRHEDPTELYIS